MDISGSFGGLEASPREGVQAQIDGRRVERVDGIVEVRAETLVLVQRPGDADQGLGEVLPDPPGAHFIGVSQREVGNPSADAHAVELVALGAQADHEIAQGATAGDLRDGPAQELVRAGERANAAVAAIATDAAMQGVERQVVSNDRFLLLPGVGVKHLASHVLGQAARRLAADPRGPHWPLESFTSMNPSYVIESMRVG